MSGLNEDTKNALGIFYEAIPQVVIDGEWTIGEWTIDEFRAFVSKLTFTPAETYRHSAPHEYVLFKVFGSDLKKELATASRFIEDHGYIIHFYGGSAFNCLNLDGKRYWTAFMTDDHSAPNILNRTSNDNRQGIPSNQLHLLDGV